MGHNRLCQLPFCTQRYILIILIDKVRRMFDRLEKIYKPPGQSDFFAQVIGVTACGGTKPVVKRSAESCDIAERSGLVRPLTYLPADVRDVVSDASRLFPNPLGGLAEYQGIKGADCTG